MDCIYQHYLRIGGKAAEMALLGLFSTSFPNPVQGVSPAALNALIQLSFCLFHFSRSPTLVQATLFLQRPWNVGDAGRLISGETRGGIPVLQHCLH